MHAKPIVLTEGPSRLSILLLIFIFISAASKTAVSGQASSGKAVDESRMPLEAGKTLEREITGGQKHVYTIHLGQDQAAKVEVKQSGIDLTLELFGPDGNLIVDVDSQSSVEGIETVAIVSESPATYEVRIVPALRKAGNGNYSVTAAELRSANADDRSLFEALRQYYESRRLLIAGGQNDRALELAKTSLATRERVLGSQHPLTVASLFVLGGAYTSKNDIAQAETYIKSALAVVEKTSGRETPQYAEGLFLHGRAVANRGDMRGAEKLMLEALRIFDKSPGKGGFRVAVVLSNLGMVYRALSDFRQAELTFRKGLDVCEKTVGEDHNEVANILNNLSLMYNAAGDYQTAEKEMLRSLAIMEKLQGLENRDAAIALNNLGMILWRKKDYDKAESVLLRALTIFEKVNGPESDGVANVLGNLGIIYKEHYKDYAKAEAAQKRAIAITEKLSGEYSLLTGVGWSSLGLIYRAQGDYAKAESVTRRALEVYERSIGPNHQNVVLALMTLSQLSAMRGDFAASLASQKRIEAIENMSIQTNLIMGSERQKIAFFSRLRSMDRAVSFLVDRMPDNPQARDLVANQVFQRKGRILDALSQNLSEFRSRSGPEDKALLSRLNELTADISKLAVDGRKSRSQAEYDAQLKALTQERDKIESEIGRRSAGSYVPTKPVELSAVRAAIPLRAALVEFVVYRPFEWNYNEAKEPYGEPRYIAFVLRNHGDIKWVSLGDAKSVDDAVGALRSSLRDPKSKDFARLARVVDEKVLAPVRALAGNATHLIVSPDGELNLLPFGALVDEQQRFLAQRFSFTYVSSGRDLLRTGHSQAHKKEFLILADPAFGDSTANNSDSAPKTTAAAARQNRVVTRSLSESYFAPLSGTAREGAAIKAIFPDARMFSGADATETAIKKVTGPGILHIATHGFFLNVNAPPPGSAANAPAATLPENPLLRSGLAFAGANRRADGQDDGILTALEASGLNLSGTKLVVLSACDTGVGEVRNGEGVYGLRRSFTLAGAESLVMSLWPVSDFVTRELMTGYYKNLKNGMGRGEALRQVQLAMIKSPTRRHPFYWASFIQSGEWANLDGKRP